MDRGWETPDAPAGAGRRIGLVVALVAAAALGVALLSGGDPDPDGLEVVTETPPALPAVTPEPTGPPDPDDPPELIEATTPVQLEDRWRPIPAAPLRFKTSPPGVWDGDGLVVFNGTQVARFDPWSWTWRQGRPAPGVLAQGWSATWTGRDVAIWGGGGALGIYRNDGLRYRPLTDRWAYLPAAPLRSRSRHGAVGFDGALVVWGGEGITGDLFADGALWRPTAGWEPLPSAPLSPRRDPYLAIQPPHPGDAEGTHQLIVWGGEDETGGLNDGAILSLADGAWTPIPPGPVAFRPAPAVVWAPTCLPAGRETEVIGIDPESGTPVELCPGRLLVWGMPAAGLPEAWTWSYDPDTEAWTPLPPLLQQTRSDAAAVWNGVTALVWGGTDWRGTSTLADGFTVEPDSRRWRRLPVLPGPRRLGATVVWTGEPCAQEPCHGDLIVWGGSAEVGGVPLGDGALHAWPPVPLAGRAHADAERARTEP